MVEHESAQHPAQEQEPERVYRHDYIKVARAYEQRLAEAPDDAVLDTLRATLDAYEFEIRAIPRDRVPMYAFPDRLALAARMAGAFKPADRGELGDLMAQLVDAFEAYKQQTERRIENASHGYLPDGLEDALHPLADCMELLWSACEHDVSRSAIDYLVEQMRDHVAQVRRAALGEDDADEEHEAA